MKVRLSSSKVGLFLVATAAQLLSKAHAQTTKKIDQWNTDNVETESGPYEPGGTYNSFVFTDDTMQVTNGGVVWVESDVQAPGMKTVTDGDGSPSESCIMTAGFDPLNPPDVKQCNDDFQTSKRVKVVQRVSDDTMEKPIDLVFDVSPSEVSDDPAYRFFLKYENLTPDRIASFEIELGTETGDSFTPGGTGLAFTNRAGDTTIDLVGTPEDIDLGVFFAFGLFGDASTNPNQDNDGYYDPVARGTFDVTAPTPVKIEATQVSMNVGELYDDSIGSWLSKSQVPCGFVFDNDGDPATEAPVVADWDGTNWLSRRLCDDQIAEDAGIGLSGSNECRSAAIDAPEVIGQATIDSWISDPSFSVVRIEDFGNVNFNGHIQVSNLFVGSDFTIRITPLLDTVTPAETPWLDNFPWQSDLAITDIQAEDGEIEVKVENLEGDEVVTAEVTVRVLYEDGTVGARFSEVISNLEEGDSTTISFSWDIPSDRDDELIIVEAAVEACVDDEDEDNNKLSVAVGPCEEFSCDGTFDFKTYYSIRKYSEDDDECEELCVEKGLILKYELKGWTCGECPFRP